MLNDRIRAFVESRAMAEDTLQRLKGDASTRSYYRIESGDGPSSILMVYASAGDPSEEAFVRMTAFLESLDVPVPSILERDTRRGILLLQDLGDVSMRRLLEKSDGPARMEAMARAVELIVRLQREGTPKLAPGVPAYHTRFDREVFERELRFFHGHFFSSLAPSKLSIESEAALHTWYGRLAVELAAKSSVLCHRDYHMDNLFIHDGRLCIIDYQDARIGPAAYDLVSLLLDRDIDRFIDAGAVHRLYTLFLSLSGIDASSFAGEYGLAAVQRCLKALGTFAFQVSKGRRGYFAFVNPTLERLHKLFRGEHELPEGWRHMAKHLPEAVGPDLVRSTG